MHYLDIFKDLLDMKVTGKQECIFEGRVYYIGLAKIVKSLVKQGIEFERDYHLFDGIQSGIIIKSNNGLFRYFFKELRKPDEVDYAIKNN